MPSRREFLVALAASAVARRSLLAERAPSVITVYKDPGCDCCVKWVKHLSANGFVVSPNDVQNMDEIKRTMNVPTSAPVVPYGGRRSLCHRGPCSGRRDQEVPG